jgi:hypothetical protein
MLRSRNQKGVRLGYRSCYYLYGDVITPDYRRHPTSRITYAERGKPVFLPTGQANRKKRCGKCG